ncbi:MAG: glycosyltransferase [Ignavibacteriae bacterium]|nr:glycosyltransferase [Ignavibacteriota bacterium]
MLERKEKKIVFITWAEYGSRMESISIVLNAEPIFIANVRKEKKIWVSAFLYFSYAYRNIKILSDRKPDIIIITNTVWPIALVNFLYAKITKTKLVLDSHSCAFDYVFYKYPLFLSLIFAKYSDLSFVTNQNHLKLVQSKGGKAVILSDIPFESKFESVKKRDLGNKFNICYICSFSYDEPYFELIEAAKNLPDVQIFITGNYPIANITPEKYEHVKFTGYINNYEYRTLLKSVDAIISLTRNEDTMQRAGSESISVGKPLILSDTKMLKNYFTQGTVFVKNTPEEIANGITELRNEFEKYSFEIIKFQKERSEKFDNKLNEIKEILELK